MGAGEEGSLRREGGRVRLWKCDEDFVFQTKLLGTQRMRIVFFFISLEVVQRKIRGCRKEKLRGVRKLSE